jgi:4-amino-4-deoxy-L-arabinose transferase-like glycosyltransferase
MMQILKDSSTRWLLLGAALVHLLLASSFHLSPDETQYTLYSAHLDWSFFDHPPLVGWLQWPWGALGGTDLLMRVVPMASWLLGALALLALTATMYPGVALAPRAALLLWALSPIPHLLGVALVPDSLLLPIICASMVFCWQLCDVRQLQRTSLWLGLGLCLGLAGLTKYTAILIALGAVLALLISHGPRLLARPGPWLAVLLAALLISPVLLWNATHDWISLAYQFSHAAGGADWRFSRVLAFVLVQVLGYGALLLLGGVASWRQPEGGRSGQVTAQRISPVGFCLCFGLPALLLLTYLSGRGSTLPHWSASAWMALTPAAAMGCLSMWSHRQALLKAVGGFQALCCAGLATLMLVGGVSSEVGEQAHSKPGQVPAGSAFNPFADLYGWDAAAAHGRALAEKNPDAQGVQPTLAVFNWTLASRIAWYARPLGVKVVQRHFDQFGLWWGVLQPGESVLLLDWSQMSFAPPVGPGQFERCELLDQQAVPRLGRQIAHFNFLLCHHWQGPADPSLGRNP